MHRRHSGLTRSLLMLTGALCVASRLSAAEVPILLKDINTKPEGSRPSDFIEFDGGLFFNAVDGEAGPALWRRDGGVVSLVDAGDFWYPAVAGGELLYWRSSELWVTDGSPMSSTLVRDDLRLPAPRTRVEFSGQLAFFATPSGVLDTELWVSDGTTAGTMPITDICSGPCDGVVRTAGLAVLGASLYFAGVDGSGTQGLWRSDDTPGSATLVHAVSGELMEVTTWNGQLLFLAEDGGTYGLYVSDGTASGTSQVIAAPGNGLPGTLRAAGDRAYFAAGTELWRTDGTAGGTVAIADLCPGCSQVVINDIVPVAGQAFAVLRFFTFTPSSFSITDQLWRTDGTMGGTQQLAELSASECSYTSGTAPIVWPKAFGSSLVFLANDASTGDEPWISDGTAQGTGPLRDIVPGEVGSSAAHLEVIGGTIYLAADDGSGMELWSSDGTSSGTTQHVLFEPTGAGSYPDVPTLVGSRAIFAASTDEEGREMYSTTGSPGDALLLADIYPGACSGPQRLTGTGAGCGTSIGEMAVVADRLLFSARDEQTGLELWASDGTVAGTRMLGDVQPGDGSSSPTSFAATTDRLFYWAYDDTFGLELRGSDGTPGGTQLLSDACPGACFDCNFSSLAATAGNTLLYVRDDGVTGGELWVSDGVPGGERLVRDICPGNCSSWITREIGVLGSTLFFAASDGVNGQELWRSDGTVAGTQMVKDICPGSCSSDLIRGVVLGGQILFLAAQNFGAFDLWATEGTDSGTAMLAASVTPSLLVDAVEAGGMLYFSAYDPSSFGSELWVSDGTPTGTGLVRDICPGTCSSFPTPLVEVGGQLLFMANDGVTGSELWRSDGTAANTTLVRDIWPGVDSSSPFTMAQLNGVGYFTANDGLLGRELWRSDGTGAGTWLVKDIRPGPGSGVACTASGPSAVGGRLYFAADDGTTGCELWVLDPLATPAQLLRNDELTGINPPTPPLSGVLPLDALDDAYIAEVVNGDSDPELDVLMDLSRPLVFYGIAGSTGPANSLRMVKSGMVQIRYFF